MSSLNASSKETHSTEGFVHQITEHAMSVKKTLKSCESRMTGLTSDEHTSRLAQYGANVLTPPATRPQWLAFVLHLTSGFSMLLWVGSILCFISYALNNNLIENVYLGAVLAIVVFLSGVFAFYQDAAATKAMEGFKSMQPEEATVVRDGSEQRVFSRTLVVGDIVRLKSGDRVPADVRLLEATGLKVDNSSLTGESEPQTREAIVEDESIHAFAARNIVWSSTFVTNGTATGIVIRTGDHTMIGSIAAVVADTGASKTPIRREINHFIRVISAVAIVLGVAFFTISMIQSRGEDWIGAVVFLIGIIVANVPEGLLPTVTVSLTLTAKRMARKHVLVKNLESVETLGSTSTICTDKTGTLTQNRMTVAHVWYDGAIFNNEPGDAKYLDIFAPACAAILRVTALCSRATFDDGGGTAGDEDGADEMSNSQSLATLSASERALKAKHGGRGAVAMRNLRAQRMAETPILLRQTIGDASESALIKFAQYYRDIYEMRDANPKLAELPFSSVHKYQLSVHMTEDPDDTRLVLLLKGAPERVIDRCTHILRQGKRQRLTRAIRAEYEDALMKLASMGERVLACAHSYLDSKKYTLKFEFDAQEAEPNFPTRGLTLLGLVSLIDPPRPSVPLAVATCRRAGIRVIMVTGDHPATAASIAKQVGIVTAQRELQSRDVTADTKNTYTVVTGDELRSMSEEELLNVLKRDEVVFSRTTPHDKLRIVEGCQMRGQVVAVTGDGVNDSPALKRADIGVAMGIAGTDVAKNAADMILMDDNFASIVMGVEEGRLVFDNLKKSIAYTLSSNIPEILPFLINVLFGMPLALTTVMILCIDLGTDLLPAISLAYEPAESDIMKRPPRTEQDKLVNKRLISFSYLQIGIMQALGGLFNFIVLLMASGVHPTQLFGSAEAYSLANEESRTYDYWNAGSGQFVSFDERSLALRKAQTAYLLSIVQTQWADVLIVKTRRLSFFKHGVRNVMVVIGIFFETMLIIAMIYTPALNTVFGTEPLELKYWFLALPFVALIFIYDECRKALIRKYQGGWLARNTIY